MHPVNVAVLGDTGVGKSSLVNAVLGQQAAQVAIGAPVRKATRGSEYFITDDGALGLWDFEGFHYGPRMGPRSVLALRIGAIQLGRPQMRIDVAWYCFQASTGRLTGGQRRLLSALRDLHIPILGVLTKVNISAGQASSDAQLFALWLENQKLGLAVEHIFLTSTVAEVELGLDAFGVPELLAATRVVALGRR